MSDPAVARGRHAWLGGMALLALAALHVAQVWGYWGLYWGDPGQVLGQLERFAAGEQLYADFVVFSPPLGYWVIGLAARVIGAEPTQIALITSVIFLAVVAVWWSWAQRLIDDTLALPAACTALVFAAALACLNGVALPLGTYAPSAPIGFLSLVVALLALGSPDAPLSRPRALLCGIACGACVLAKQDFWAPALFVASSRVIFSLRYRDPLGAACVALGSSATLLAGCATIAASAGWRTIPLIATGYGVASESGFARSAPTLERLTLEGIALALLAMGGGIAACLAHPAKLSARRVILLAAVAGVGLAALHFSVSASLADSLGAPGAEGFRSDLAHRLISARSAGASLAAAEARYLIEELCRRPLPLLLPLAVGACLWQRRKFARSRALDSALWWIGLCIAARLRRGFESTEWFHALLEVPIYLMAARAIAPQAWRGPARIALALMGVAASYCWWSLGDGPLSARGVLPVFESERGRVRWQERQIPAYNWLRDRLDERDPERLRPVFSFGHNGGHAYWLRRLNPSPCTYGLVFCGASVDSLIADLRSQQPPAFLVYNGAYEGQAVPDASLAIDHWELPLRLNALVARDLANFDRAAEGCREIARRGEQPRRMLRVFDCPAVDADLGEARQREAARGSASRR